jgi:hypothetical protein
MNLEVEDLIFWSSGLSLGKIPDFREFEKFEKSGIGFFSVRGREPLQYHPCIRAIRVVLLFFFPSFARRAIDILRQLLPI